MAKVEDKTPPVRKAAGKEDETPKESKYLVALASTVAVVLAGSERDAVKAIAAANGSGKYMVVDVDFVEVFSASHRVELKTDSTEAVFTEEGQ